MNLDNNSDLNQLIIADVKIKVEFQRSSSESIIKINYAGPHQIYYRDTTIDNDSMTLKSMINMIRGRIEMSLDLEGIKMHDTCPSWEIEVVLKYEADSIPINNVTVLSHEFETYYDRLNEMCDLFEVLEHIDTSESSYSPLIIMIFLVLELLTILSIFRL